ncbi:hypothetical protein ACP4OV_019957 [Aristida adscensionis]
MTCNHVIAEAENVHVRLPGSSVEYEVERLYSHEEADLAVLRVIGMQQVHPALEFQSSEDVPIEGLVFLIAYYHPERLRRATSIVCLNPGVVPGPHH